MLKYYIIILLSLICYCCSNTYSKKHLNRYNLIYETCGDTNEMIFHNPTNSYKINIYKVSNGYVLTVIDTITNSKYKFYSKDRIYIKGGTIK